MFKRLNDFWSNLSGSAAAAMRERELQETIADLEFDMRIALHRLEEIGEERKRKRHTGSHVELVATSEIGLMPPRGSSHTANLRALSPTPGTVLSASPGTICFSENSAEEKLFESWERAPDSKEPSKQTMELNAAGHSSTVKIRRANYVSDQEEAPDETKMRDIELSYDSFACLITTSPTLGRMIVLPVDRPLIIGRGDHVPLGSYQLIIPDKAISRKHATIETENGKRHILKDCATINGTYVDGHRISSHVLKSGDEIVVPLIGSPHFRAIYISRLHLTLPSIVNPQNIRQELVRLVPNPEEISLILSDSGLPRVWAQGSSSEYIWENIIDRLTRRGDARELSRLLNSVADRGYRSDLINLTLPRLPKAS